MTQITPNTGQFAVGDLVVLDRKTAEGWAMPWRDFAKKGRVGRVFAVGELKVWVDFGKRARQTLDFWPTALLPNPNTGETR